LFSHWEDDVFIADGSLGPGMIELSQTLASSDDCMKEHGGVAFSKNLDFTNFAPCIPSNAISFFCGAPIMAILRSYFHSKVLFVNHHHLQVHN
jgi:hypothetical protein